MTGPDGSGRPSLATSLRAEMAHLTPAERKIARAILASYPFAALEPIADLAVAAGVSAPSVVRFARALGFGGYREFQEALRAEIRQRETMSVPVTEARIPDQGYAIEAVRHACRTGVEETFDSVIGDELDRIVDLLSQRRRAIALVGAACTACVADLFHAQLAPSRPGVMRLSSNPLLAAGELVDLKRGDVLVAFDVRRYDPAIAETVRIGKELGLTTIVFTDPWLSPAASFADHVLTAQVRSIGPTDVLSPMLALVEAVSGFVSGALGAEAVDRLAKIDLLRLRLRESIGRV